MTYFVDFWGTLSDAEGKIYADVPEFLREMGNEAIVVSSSRSSERSHIEHLLVGIVRLTVLCTDGAAKADFLAGWPGYHGGPAIVVDDRVAELTALAERFPMLKLYEMRRDGLAGDGRWPAIRSLAELP